ncbi:MAG: alpha-ketoglutarate-dependent dioxygenase AlkB, partial [Propionibacteriaceae bacterium]|nr:alpha-ketoglutarate-dependent dioxygenase AlkB [Propionibacteriaceae bacterium]
MTLDFQSSLFASSGIDVPALAGRFERVPLSDGAWVDIARGWIGGADDVFERLVSDIPWHAERREMYDRVVDVPRLLHMYGVGDELPHEALVRARDELNLHYADELGERFVTAGCCYYRDGRDSVAWHGDRIGRSRSEDTMV